MLLVWIIILLGIVTNSFKSSSNIPVKHGCAKLFGKTFQEQENGVEVTSRLGLLQKTGPGPIDSQGTNASYYADQSGKNDREILEKAR